MHPEPRKLILIGRYESPENIVSCMHLINDCTVLAVGTKKGSLSVYESKNLLDQENKLLNKVLDKKEIKMVKLTRRLN